MFTGCRLPSFNFTYLWAVNCKGMWTLHVFIEMAFKVGLIHRPKQSRSTLINQLMQLTTSSEPKSSRPTAKNKTKKLKVHWVLTFMNAWLQMTRTVKQWSAGFTKQSGHALTIKLTKNKFILVWQWIFSRKLASTNKTSIWSKPQWPPGCCTSKAAPSWCAEVSGETWLRFLCATALYSQLGVAFLFTVHNLSNCKSVLSFMLKYSHKHGVP